MPRTEIDLRRRRLRSQLLAPQAGTALDVVQRLGALQAQNRASALLAIGVRARDSTIGDVERLFDDGLALRSWTMRGTLHVVATPDLPWMLGLTAARQRAVVAHEARRRGIEGSDFDRAAEIIHRRVVDGGPATRAEAVDALVAAGIDVGDEQAYRYIRDAALRGLVAWGPMRGRQPLLVTVSPAADLDRDEALGRFITTYLAGHGPATVRDFAWWSGLTLTDARRALLVAGSEIERWNDHDDEPLLITASSTDDTTDDDRRTLRSVPAWDEYVLGYRERSHVLAPEFAPRVSPSGNGVFLPTILSDGAVAGTWSYTLSRAELAVASEPFTGLTASEQRRFASSATQVARFFGLSVA